MPIALITDIHANREAFTACVAHAERHGASHYALLGDFVGYGPDPGFVVDQIMELVAGGAVAVMGNHDEAVVKGARPNMTGDARTVIEWTRGQLSAVQLDFLAGLPMKVEDDPVLYVHANAWDPQGYEYIFGTVEAGRSMRATAQRITFCGHVHVPMLYHMGLTQRVEEFQPHPGSAIPLSAARRWLAIPGSCGQPRDGNPAACYAMFDELNALLTFYRVPYDHYETSRKIRAAGLPQRVFVRLEEGV
jgi:diadenosine tetraphosphatase ApaH/serine/threonine PP2A family protein phosphatase